MTARLQGFALAFGALVAFVLLSARNLQDWQRCMEIPDAGLWQAARHEFVLFLTPVGWAATAPFVLFGALWYVRRRRVIHALWAVAALLLVVPNLVSDFHQCDRKGMDAALWAVVAAVPAFLLWIFALDLSSPQRPMK